MTKIVMTKQCQCKSTSSGPRTLLKSRMKPTGLAIEAHYVQMACNACDTPWSVEVIAEPQRAIEASGPR